MVLCGLVIGCSIRGEEAEPKIEELDEKSVRPDPFAESLSSQGEVVLHAGFSPDPLTVVGKATGEVPAKGIHRRCHGWVGAQPDYLVRATTAFLKLHVMARSEQDILLVVRKPDGRVLCNDNRYGKTDPMIHSDFPIGTAQVFIGTRSEGREASYRLGFSELKWKPSELELP